MAQSSAQDNLKTMRTYFDLLFGKEMQPLLDMFADDVNWFIVATGTTISGKEELKAGAQNHWAASPDRAKKLVNLFATDEFACLEYTSGGTLEVQANFGDIAIKPTGKRYELQCCFVFHFRPDGKIDRVREYFDMGTVTRQIGAMPMNRGLRPSHVISPYFNSCCLSEKMSGAAQCPTKVFTPQHSAIGRAVI